MLYFILIGALLLFTCSIYGSIILSDLRYYLIMNYLSKAQKQKIDERLSYVNGAFVVFIIIYVIGVLKFVMEKISID